MRQCLPSALRDQSFAKVLNNEEAVLRWLSTLAKNIAPGDDASGPGSNAGGADGSGSGSLAFTAAGASGPNLSNLSALSSLGGAGDGKGFPLGNVGAIGGANWNANS